MTYEITTQDGKVVLSIGGQHFVFEAKEAKWLGRDLHDASLDAEAECE